MLRYKRINTHFFTDTFFVTRRATSSRGHTCMQLFVSDKGFVFVVPMKSKGEFLDAFKMFTKEIGVPDALIIDPSGEQTSSASKKYCQQVGTTLRVLEVHTQWANRAELYIGQFKCAVRKDMKKINSPLVFCDYCAERRARIHKLTAKHLFQLQGQNPMSATLCEERDISNLCRHGWYNWCYYREQSTPTPMQTEMLGRVLGPTKNVANSMSQRILKANKRIVPRTTVCRLLPAELAPTNHVEKERRRKFDEVIKQRYGDVLSLPDKLASNFIPYKDDETEPMQMPSDEDPVDSEERAAGEQSVFDRLIHAELNQYAKVLSRKRDEDGNVISMYDDNPLLNTMLYDVEFADGAV